jgi:hypothetical protein
VECSWLAMKAGLASDRRAMAGFSALEQRIVTSMARVDRERDIMEQQLAAAKVVERDYTDHGFFTKVAVPDSVPTLDRGRWRYEDMPRGFADHPSLLAGASFILWIKDGHLVTLEGFTNEGYWPDDEAGFRVAV